jgi:TcpE family
VELPTYTGIWRIEKRLYKLYDFRLPMPLPVGQIAVFVAITVPYVLLLTLFGLPFSHTLFWLYVLPPAVLTWLAGRCWKASGCLNWSFPRCAISASRRPGAG